MKNFLKLRQATQSLFMTQRFLFAAVSKPVLNLKVIVPQRDVDQSVFLANSSDVSSQSTQNFMAAINKINNFVVNEKKLPKPIIGFEDLGGAKPQQTMLKGRNYFEVLKGYAQLLTKNDLIPRLLFRGPNGVSLKAQHVDDLQNFLVEVIKCHSKNIPWIVKNFEAQGRTKDIGPFFEAIDGAIREVKRFGHKNVLIELAHSYKETAGEPNEEPQKYYQKVIETEKLKNDMDLKHLEVYQHSLKAMDGTVSGKNLISVLEAMASALQEIKRPQRLFLHSHAPFEIPQDDMKPADTNNFSSIVQAISNAVIFCQTKGIDFGFDAVTGKGGGFPNIAEIINCLEAQGYQTNMSFPEVKELLTQAAVDFHEYLVENKAIWYMSPFMAEIQWESNGAMSDLVKYADITLTPIFRKKDQEAKKPLLTNQEYLIKSSKCLGSFIQLTQQKYLGKAYGVTPGMKNIQNVTLSVLQYLIKKNEDLDEILKKQELPSAAFETVEPIMANYFLYPMPAKLHPDVQKIFCKMRVKQGLKSMHSLDSKIAEQINKAIEKGELDQTSREAGKKFIENNFKQLKKEVIEDIAYLFGNPDKVINLGVPTVYYNQDLRQRIIHHLGKASIKGVNITYEQGLAICAMMDEATLKLIAANIPLPFPTNQSKEGYENMQKHLKSVQEKVLLGGSFDESILLDSPYLSALISGQMESD